MDVTKQPITQDGMNKLKNEIKNIQLELPSIANEISRAKEYGDLSENSEYKAAKDKQARTFNKLRYLEGVLANSYLLESERSNNTVLFGSKLHLMNMSVNKEMNITIVSEYESDFAKGLISCLSPVGKGLMGKKKNDIVSINSGGRLIKYQILNIE